MTKINERIQNLEDRMDEQEEHIYSSYIIAISIISILVVLMLIFVPWSTHKSIDTSTEAYCHYFYGNDSYYDQQQGKPFEVRSCNIINETDGSYIEYYFTMNRYNSWADTMKETNK